MKKEKFISLLIFSIVFLGLVVTVLWRFILPLDIKESISIIRWRREMDPPPTTPTPIIDIMIESSSNKTTQRTSENILLNALGHLQISCPEDIMAFIQMQSSCSDIKPYLKVFERNHKDLSDDQLFVRLFKAVEKFYAIFCGKNERFRRIFIEHEAELKGLHEQFADCQGAPDWYENKNSSLRCTEAANIVKCYGESLRNEINESTARAFVCLLEQVLNVTMTGPCSFTTVAIDLSFHSSSASNSSEFIAIILFFTLVVIFM